MPRKRKKWGKESEERGEERKWKVILETAVSLLNPKTITKFCFLHMPKLCKLIFCIWIRRSQSVQPVNSFMVGFSILKHDSDQETAWLASKRIFGQNFWSEWVNLEQLKVKHQGCALRTIMDGAQMLLTYSLYDFLLHKSKSDRGCWSMAPNSTALLSLYTCIWRSS